MSQTDAYSTRIIHLPFGNAEQADPGFLTMHILTTIPQLNVPMRALLRALFSGVCEGPYFISLAWLQALTSQSNSPIG